LLFGGFLDTHKRSIRNKKRKHEIENKGQQKTFHGELDETCPNLTRGKKKSKEKETSVKEKTPGDAATDP